MSKVVLNSNKIKVFPFGSTRVNDPLSRVLNEQNIASIVKNLTDKSNYVIDYNTNNDTVDFVIQGYRFSIDLEGFTEISSNESVYAIANISVDEDTGYSYLTGNDTTNVSQQVFTGVELVVSVPDDVNSDNILHIFESVEGEWVVPTASKINIDFERITSRSNSNKNIEEDFKVIDNSLSVLSQQITNMSFPTVSNTMMTDISNKTDVVTDISQTLGVLTVKEKTLKGINNIDVTCDSQGNINIENTAVHESPEGTGIIIESVTQSQGRIKVKYRELTASDISLFGQTKQAIMTDEKGLLKGVTTLPIDVGGTGASTAEQARTNLGFTGAVTSIITENLEADKVVITTEDGKIGSSSVSTTALGYIIDLEENVQDALDYTTSISEALDGQDDVSTFFDIIYCGTATDLID